MAKALYLVLHSRNDWWVDIEGKAHGPFASRENAALEARSLARFDSQSGRVCEVLVPDEQGRFWVIWSSLYDGNDSGASFVPHRVAS